MSEVLLHKNIVLSCPFVLYVSLYVNHLIRDVHGCSNITFSSVQC